MGVVLCNNGYFNKELFIDICFGVDLVDVIFFGIMSFVVSGLK